MNTITTPKLFDDIKRLIVKARTNVYRTINSAMVTTYFQIGRMIVEEEQMGHERAIYGEHTLETLSDQLTNEFGKGFSLTNLKQMKTFYLTYSKGQAVTDQSLKFELSWTHYIFLMRLDEPTRKFYEIESKSNDWSIRELKRQFDSGLYERLALKRNGQEVAELSQAGQIIEQPKDLIKDPYIFEFLGLKESREYSENELETKLINHLEEFLLELGKGFAFISRQERITYGEKHFFIDLVFYNRLLKCFVVIDLKIGELKHQDVGQLQMYVNYYDRKVKTDDENKTVGILICADKDDAMIEMTLPEDNKQLFTSKYNLYLPTKEELKKQIKFE